MQIPPHDPSGAAPDSATAPRSGQSLRAENYRKKFGAPHQVRLSPYLKSKLDTFDQVIFRPGSVLGPEGMENALIEFERALANEPEMSREEAIQKLRMRMTGWLVELAAGKPNKYAPQRTVRPNERTKAMDLLFKITGAAAAVENLGPQGRQADAQDALINIARRIASGEAPVRTIDVTPGGQVRHGN